MPSIDKIGIRNLVRLSRTVLQHFERQPKPAISPYCQKVWSDVYARFTGHTITDQATP